MVTKKVVLLLAVPHEQTEEVASLLRGPTNGRLVLEGRWLEDRYQAIVR